jgi:photosystem II stability/assembly factor-like uncharacterized protein
MKIIISILLATCFISTATIQAQTDFWQQTTGPSGCEYGCQVTCLATTDSGDLFAGTYGGLYKSIDKGDSWIIILSGLPQYGNYIAFKLPNYIFAASGNLVSISTDGGTNWSSRSIYTGKQILHVAVSPSGSIFLGTDDSGVIRSSDNGTTWISKDSGLSDLHINSMGISGFGNILVGTWYNKLFRSTDDGESWNDVSSSLFAGFIDDIVKAGDGRTIVSTSDGLYQSTDNDSTWTSFSSPKVFIGDQGIAINSLGYIFLANFFDGIYRSRDGGMSWGLRNSGLNNSNMLRVIIDYEGRAYASPYAGPVFRSTDLTTNVGENVNGFIQNFTLSQNYPNPFNPRTTIKFEIPSTGFVTLEVFDLLGRKVATIVNEKMTQGTYEKTIDGTKISGGVYYYRLKTNNYMQTKKLLLLK